VFNLCAGGLETEQEYPYDAVGETCKFEKSEAVVYVNGSVSISKDETSEFHPVHNFVSLLQLRHVQYISGQFAPLPQIWPRYIYFMGYIV